jgi:hypothetical protein
MIHYDLHCSEDHAFDGWFKDSAAFERLAKRGLLECPHCGDAKVERALMRPAVAKREALPVPVPAPQPSAPPAAVAGGPMPAHMRAMLQHMRAELEKNCDYVGPQFAEEARKIHRGESDKRSIYGETSPEQAEALADEASRSGIPGSARRRVVSPRRRQRWFTERSRPVVHRPAADRRPGR